MLRRWGTVCGAHPLPPSTPIRGDPMRRPFSGDCLQCPSAESFSSDLEQRRPHAPEFAVISCCKIF
jgi:hypothetical protein